MEIDWESFGEVDRVLFPKPLVVQHLKGQAYQVIVDFPVICIPKQGRIVEDCVPAGYVSDGASIPRMARMLFCPWSGNYIESSVYHDFRYSMLDTTRELADSLFYHGMVHNGVDRVSASMMYSAVRVGGWMHWRKNNA